jgi:hypothetical protein
MEKSDWQKRMLKLGAQLRVTQGAGLIGYGIVWLGLTITIHLYGVYLADAYSGPIQLCSVVPIAGQACLIWANWSATGVLRDPHSYLLLCVLWLIFTAMLGLSFALWRLIGEGWHGWEWQFKLGQYLRRRLNGIRRILKK